MKSDRTEQIHKPAVPADMLGDESPESIPSAERDLGSRIDPVSLKVIELLQKDGRRSYASLAKELGLSEAAVRQRVQKLMGTGVIQVVAVADPISLGLGRQALVGVRARGDLRKVADEISKIPEADYVVVCAGSWDIFVEIVSRNDEDLLRVINDGIRCIDGVQATEAFVYLKLAKQTYTWNLR